MAYLAPRNATYGMDLKIAASMTARAEILTGDAVGTQGTDVSVLELINALCDVLDGNDVHDIKGMTGLSDEQCVRIDDIRNKVSGLWTYRDGRKVQG